MSKDMEKASNVPAWMAKGVEKFSPTTGHYDTVPVEINLGDAFEAFLQTFYRRLETSVQYKGGTLGFDYIGWKSYVYTLVDSRVHHVMREYGASAPIIHYNSDAAVPVLVEKILSSIGIAKVGKFTGITFVPSFTVEADQLLSRLQFRQMTLELKTVMEAGGITFGDVAYERKTEGVLDMMAMQYLRNGFADVQGPLFNERTSSGVYSHAEMSPAYAPLAFLLGLRQMQSLLGARVFYADESAFEEHLITLATA